MKALRYLTVALFCTGLVFAQATTEPATAPAKAGKTPTAVKAEKAPAVVKVAEKRLVGSVVSVDTVGNTLIVKSKKGDDTLSVDTTAKIKVDGKEGKLGELASGNTVMVMYKMDGTKMVATKIMKKSEAAAAKPAAKKEKETAPAAAPAAPEAK